MQSFTTLTQARLLQTQRIMADTELSFDDLFIGGNLKRQDDQSLQHKGQPVQPPRTPLSPMFPKAPNPTTTATPISTPKVVRPPWNYTEELREAFPDAEFSGPANHEDLTLQEWLKLKKFESRNGDHRLAVLVSDRGSPKKAQKSGEKCLMSGALPNDREQKTQEHTGERNEGARSEGNAVRGGMGRGKNRGEVRAKRKRKDSLLNRYRQDELNEESEDDDGPASVDFKESLYGIGIGDRWR